MIRCLKILLGLFSIFLTAGGVCQSPEGPKQSPLAPSGDLSQSLDARYKFNEQDHKTFLTWLRDAIQDSKTSGNPVIIIDKADHKLYLIKGTKLILWYPVELGGYNPYDPKTMIYDGCTPEGIYKITDVKEGSRTKYHLAFLIDYPNKEDKARFARYKKEGRIPQEVSIGGLIEIHGGGTGFGGNDFGRDWTAGCVALANEYIDQIAKHVSVGSKVVIVRYGTRSPEELNPGLPNLYKWEKAN